MFSLLQVGLDHIFGTHIQSHLNSMITSHGRITASPPEYKTKGSDISMLFSLLWLIGCISMSPNSTGFSSLLTEAYNQRMVEFNEYISMIIGFACLLFCTLDIMEHCQAYKWCLLPRYIYSVGTLILILTYWILLEWLTIFNYIVKTPLVLQNDH